MSLCNFCNSSFANKHNLIRHLREKKCKSEVLQDWATLHNLLYEVQEVKVEPTQEFLQEPYDNLLVNSINKLTTDHIPPEKMKEFIEKYSYGDLPLFLREYIKDIICNKALPQNHSVKYITKNPPRIYSLVENDYGEKMFYQK